MKNHFSNNSLVTLDCTLRDGGYYNSWDFDEKIVSRYLQSIGTAGVDVIEIGFRLPPKGKFLGAFAYSTDHCLRKLTLPESSLLAVMTNAKDFISYDGGVKQAVKDMFDKAENSPLSIVRICSHFEGVKDSKAITEELKALGYQVCFNLMQVTEKTPDELAHVTKEIASWGTVDVFYFADSLGAMNTADVQKTVETIQKEWKSAIGIHAHDNKGQALSNTTAAIDCGVQWLDGTVLGMGRGAGNTPIEYLLLKLKEKGYDKYDPESVFIIAMEDFKKLQTEYGWGSNLLYYLSASYGIHPTYVQEMISALHYDSHQILEALKTLKKWGANAYSQDHLREAMLGGVSFTEGTWSAKDWVKGRDVLIIGAGPNARAHSSALVDFIDVCKPYVISLNSEPNIPSEKIDTYAVCHYTRLMTELDRYTDFACPVLMPHGILSETIKKKISGLSILDYGIHVKSHTFEMKKKSCTIPGFLVAPYVFAAATVGGAKRIFLAGFDGYGPGDPRQEEMAEVIGLYKANKKAAELIALTPSTYDIEHSSVYSLRMP
jgi:4-hydroxy 2-oxovalerate aldolase